VVYRDRLYLGYGDANANLGRVIPIEIRSCDAASPPACTGEFTTAEEQIDRYRLFGDSLFIAGIDATEDGFLGNVYSRSPETDWQESRTLQGGVHVHDVAEFGGEIYAVGSGANAEEWTAGEIFAHFWVSRDRGTTFEVLERHGNEGQGDARWVRLLPLGDRLYLFGYQTDAQGDLWRLPHAVYDGETVELLPTGHPFRRLFVTETDLLGDGTALVRGIDVSVSPTRAVLWVVDADGQPVSLTQFAGWEILDAALHAPTGEVVLLAQDASDEWPRAEYQVAAWACPVISMNNCTELFNFSSRTGPASLVAWRGALYLGTARGQIWRSVGVAPDE